MDDLVRTIPHFPWASHDHIFQGLSENVGMSSLFTGEEEVFAFARACSRLVQMGTKEWAETSRDS